ncbi:hypothetical protein J2Z60_001956 [Lactobacillus colini]|uniref:Uncharacterized protein n=1 Tax=Lactobacillus colini TaxID=1819254 RepID=A0ABS4MGE2_9LACO|nr:hypothetical protein [Lactobacillus colini]MBP2058765.1 hypothetical protein [Lactobacillus colini]
MNLEKITWVRLAYSLILIFEPIALVKLIDGMVGIDNDYLLLVTVLVIAEVITFKLLGVILKKLKKV